MCPHCRTSLTFSFNYPQWASQKVSVAPVTKVRFLNKIVVRVGGCVHSVWVGV